MTPPLLPDPSHFKQTDIKVALRKARESEGCF
jgi:hypothetical protein